jgi:integrase
MITQSVQACFDLYLRKSDLAESSVALKGRAVAYFVEQFGDMPVGQVTQSHAEDYRLALVTDDRGRSSANFYLANIRPFFAWLAAGGYIVRNPFDRVRRYSPERKVRPIYTAKEVDRILTVADARWRAIVLLSAEHSLRRAEILNICRSDLQGEWLHVQGKRRTATTWPWRIKNHAEALLPVSPRLRAAFGELLSEIPAGQSYMVVKPQMYRKMLHLQAENSLTHELRNCPYGNFSRDFKKLLRRASVIPRRFQELRGTYCTALLRGGMDIGEVSKMMRHSSVDTTQMFYARYEQQELAKKSQVALHNYYGSMVP